MARVSDFVDPPVVIDVAGESWHLPPLEWSDFADWAAERDAEHRRIALEGLSPGERYLVASTLAGGGALDIGELQDLSATVAGSDWVLRRSIARMAAGTEVAYRDLSAEDKASAQRSVTPAMQKLSKSVHPLELRHLAMRLSGAIPEGYSLTDAQDEGVEDGERPDPTGD